MSETVRSVLDIGNKVMTGAPTDDVSIANNRFLLPLVHPHNKVFTLVFTVECILKLMALSKEFFQCGWNIFDLCIVTASILDLIFELVDGLSVLRGLRLVNVPDRRSNQKIKIFLIAVESFKAGTVVDNDESSAEYYSVDNRRPGKPDLHSGYRYLYFCGDWDAIVRKGLHARNLRPRSHSSVEF